MTFQHDSNARNDERILAVRKQNGMEGYGVYWAILEKLSIAEGYTLPTDYTTIAWDLRVSEDLVQQIIENYELFVVSEGCFYSPRLRDEMAILEKRKEAKSIAGQKGMRVRWGVRSDTQSEQKDVTTAENSSPQSPATPSQVGNGVMWDNISRHYSVYRNELANETETSNAALRMAKNQGCEITRQQLVKFIDTFQDKLLASGTTQTTYKDYCTHFVNWLRRELQEKTVNRLQNGKDSKGPRQSTDPSQYPDRF